MDFNALDCYGFSIQEANRTGEVEAIRKKNFW